MSIKALIKLSGNLLDDAVDVVKGVVKTSKSTKPSIFTRDASKVVTNAITHNSQTETRIVSEILEDGVKLNQKAIQELGISRLRVLENGNLSGATFATRDPAQLAKLKDAGIKRIVDFRNEASIDFERLCKDLDIEYLRFPLDNTRNIPGRARLGIDVTDDFVKNLKKYIDMVNKGQTYQGCQFGIDRTNLGLTLNYLLNPKATKAPRLLSWDNYTVGNIVNRTTKSVKKIIKKLTPDQRKMLGLPDDFEKMLTERIYNLRNTNGVLRINKLQ